MTEKLSPSWVGMRLPPALLQLRPWRRGQFMSLLATVTILLLLWNFRKASFPNVSFSTSQGISGDIHSFHRRFLAANVSYNGLLDRQSKNVGQARKEYRRRYKMEPPEGFDEWFAYAIKHKSLIIDDFDEIVTKLQPYRQYLEAGCGAEELDEDYLGSMHLLQVCIRNGTIKYIGKEQAEWIVTSFNDMLEDFVGAVPDVCFIMNLLDEPRVLIPNDQLVPAVDAPSDGAFCPAPTFISYEKQAWWSEAVLSCPKDSPARMYPGKEDTTNAGKLLEDWKSASDLCSYTLPIEHGMLISPSTLLITHFVVPIISNAGLSTFNDIFFPSIWRFDLWDDYVEADDNPWEDKNSTGYWRGSTTGGYATLNNWQKFQRHRFVSFANYKENPVWEKMDVLFSQVVQCEEDACNEQKDRFRIDQKRPFSDTWKSKIVFDIDGNGLSGRFYPLLRSNSAVFRQGIFREWHDSRIQPWLHYIPMSMELTEAKELLGYFLGDGEDVLKEVARLGKTMANATLRREDMRIYMYRLLLELSRK